MESRLIMFWCYWQLLNCTHPLITGKKVNQFEAGINNQHVHWGKHLGWVELYENNFICFSKLSKTQDHTSISKHMHFVEYSKPCSQPHFLSLESLNPSSFVDGGLDRAGELARRNWSEPYLAPTSSLPNLTLVGKGKPEGGNLIGISRHAIQSLSSLVAWCVLELKWTWHVEDNNALRPMCRG